MDGQTGGALPCAGGRAPLPGQEAGAAAELDEELAFAEPVGLDHLAEGLIGWAPGKERGGTCQIWGQLGLFPSPHSAGDIGGAGAAALPVTPVMCGGPGAAEARAESGRQKRTRGGRGVGRAWGHLGCAREPSGSLCLFLDSCAGGLGRKMGSGLAGAGWRLRHDPGDTPNRGGRGSPRGKG